MHPWDELDVVFVDVGFDKEKIQAGGRIHLGHSPRHPSSPSKNKKGNHNKKKSHSYVSVADHPYPLFFLGVQFNFLCLFAFSIVKKKL